MSGQTEEWMDVNLASSIHGAGMYVLGTLRPVPPSCTLVNRLPKGASTG